MGRPLRHHPHRYAPVEVTIRTVMGLRLLKPSKEVNEILLGVLGRALALYDVRLYDFVFFGNHLDYIIGPRDALTLARFMNYLHGNIAKEIGKLVGWHGHFWGERGRPINIVDDEALAARTRYVWEHGVKEGLVTSPLDWPGASSVKARFLKQPLRGTWFNRTAESRAQRRGKTFGKYDFATTYEITLWPTPCWEHLSEAQYHAKVCANVADIEAMAIEAARDGQHFAGLEWLEAQDPLAIPTKMKRSQAPHCHASTKDRREKYKRVFASFVEAFYEAAELLLSGVLDVAFPEGSFPRPRPFVSPAESLAPV